MTTLDRFYAARAATASDINEHMPLLHALALECRSVVEFGVRSGNSTIAFLAGLAANPGAILHSYDINPPAFDPPDLGPHLTWRFTQADTTALASIPACDLLFIDTLHDCAVVTAELIHHENVRRWIAFHDTVLFGTRDESGPGPGIVHAIFLFLASHPEWRVASHHAHNNGLLLLERSLPLAADILPP